MIRRSARVLVLVVVWVAGCVRGESPPQPVASSSRTTPSSAASTEPQSKPEKSVLINPDAILAEIPDDATPLRRRLMEELEVVFGWHEREEGKVLVAQLGFQKRLHDRDLIALAGLEGPLDLHLTNTKVTNAGLALLARMRTTLRQGRPLLPEIHQLHLNYTLVNDEGLTALASFDTLRVLDLSGTAVTDAGMIHVARLPHLQRLFLGHTKVAGPGLAYLRSLSELRELDLQSTPIDDAGLEQLPALAQLKKLVLRNTRISDVGLARLKALPNLQELDLTSTGITDSCVQVLRDLKQLRRLRIVDGTGLTERGAIQLRLALPDWVHID